MNTNSDINAALAYGLSAGVKRIIGRNGVRVDGNYYYAPEWKANFGKTVLVKILPGDFEATVFSLKGQLLGVGRLKEVVTKNWPKLPRDFEQESPFLERG